VFNFTVTSKFIRDCTEHQDRIWRLIYTHVSQTEQENLEQDNTVATLHVTQPMNPVRLPEGVEISSKTSHLTGDFGRFHCGKNDQQLPFNWKGNRAGAESPLLHMSSRYSAETSPPWRCCCPTRAMTSSCFWFLDHTRHTTVSRTPLAE
jgi:hypothetical protein